MNVLMQILADAAPAGPAGPASPQPAPPSGLNFMLPLAVAMVVFMFLMSRSQKKKEQKQRDEMFGRMQKNDRVLTIGGVIGTVMSIKDQEVVLKVDESTNTKMTFLRSSVQRVLSDESGAGAEKGGGSTIQT